MKQYLDMLKTILDEGELIPNRTGVSAWTYPHMIFRHDMEVGFPLLTTKKMAWKSIKVELEFFIKGLTDKRWLKERGVTIWNAWASRYLFSDNEKSKHLESSNLGPIYGFQWRHFGKRYVPIPEIVTGFDRDIKLDKSKDIKGIVGSRFNSDNSGEFVVLSEHKTYNGCYSIQFLQSGFKKDRVTHNQIIDGRVKDPYFPRACKIGAIGEPDLSLVNKDTYTDLYQCWRGMLARCFNKNNDNYEYYGGRGIYVHNRWLIFADFLKDVIRLEGFQYKKEDLKGYSLDKDRNGGMCYSADNCIWLSKMEQAQYKQRNIAFTATSPDGVTYESCNITKFAKQFSLKEHTISRCLKGRNPETNGWSFGYVVQPKKHQQQGVDQLANIVMELKSNPTNRQLVCSAWNPCDIDKMALPPCHVLWQVFPTKGRLHLCWFQRSVDFFLGFSFNVASYALLLHLLCKETGYTPGILTGFLSNVHIYENHLDAVKTQLEREPYSLPTVRTDKFTSIFDWTYEDTVVENYQCHPSIKAPIAV